MRLGSTIIIALMPLGVLSVMQTRDALRQVEETTLEGVGGAAMKAVRSQIDLVKEAQITTRVLANILTQSPNTGTACTDRVTAIAQDMPQAVLVAYIPLGGLMTCSSNGRVYDFKDEPLFQQMVSRALPQIVYNPHGPVTGSAVIGVSHPVFNQAGGQVGVVVISLSYTSVAPDNYVDSVALWRPTYLGTVLADGTVLLSSDPEEPVDTAVPGGLDAERLRLLADRPAHISDNGGRHILSVISVTSDLYLISVWRPDGATPWSSLATPYLLPALTWVAALVAAAFASSRLVVRHVRALSRSMTDYVTTRNRMEIPDISGAPAEIQRLHAAYEGMIRTIEQEEAELQNLVVDKDLLVREVSHRSGNSLQIIASIMRMYRREATDQKLRLVLDGLINRVIALSSTHTSLYALSGKRDVAVDVVLSNVIKRLKEIHGVALGVASKRLQPVRIDAEAAVPLALALAEAALAEAVGCYFARGGLGSDEVVVALTEVEDVIHLSVEGPEVPELQPQTNDGLASLPQRMLKQFATQLSGTANIRLENGRATVDLVFPRPDAPRRK